MHSVLKIEKISKTFKVGFIPKKVVALHNVSLEVRKGEIFGLLGPNGAGKTTTIKCILGLIYPDSGTIELMGDPIPSMRAQARIGYLAENPYIYDFLSGREYLMFSASLYGMDSSASRQKADRLIEQFRLQEAADRPLRKYSKGMLQRVGLAQALINEPDFLILDEPMSGLDPVGRKEVRDLMLSLKDEGRTILFSSHILADAELLCDRAAILLSGEIQTIGDIQKLIKNIESYEVTIASTNGTMLDGMRHEIVARSENESLVRIFTLDDLQTLISRSREQAFQIESIIPQRQTLEDLYLQKMK